MKETKESIESFIKILDIPKQQQQLLKQYGQYIENYNNIVSKNKGL